MFRMDWRLALVIVAVLPLFMLIIVLVMRRTIPLHRAVQERLDTLTRILRENLSGVRVIRAFARTGQEQERFAQATQEHTTAAIRVGKVSAVLNPATQLLMNAAILCIVWFGGIRVEAGGMTTGEIIAFINYVNQILLALIVVSNLVVMFTKAYASAGRVLEILDVEPSLHDSETRPEEEENAPAVEFRHVNFSYGGGEDELSDVSFRVPRGATVGVIGGTGVGKSTLMQLILRFYEVTGGVILVNGVPVQEYPLAVLRAKIGLVPQQVELFTGTIADNIRWGNAEASDEDVRAAAQMAQAAADEDAELQGLIGEFNLKRMAINNENSKEDKDGAKLTKLDEEIREVYARVMANEHMAAYSAAKADLDAVVSGICRIVTLAAQGQDPYTIEEHASCGGNCASCGGCH